MKKSCITMMILVLAISSGVRADEPVKTYNLFDLTYQGLVKGIGAIIEVGASGRSVYGYDFKNDSFIVGQEWTVAELDISEPVTADIGLGYIQTSIDRDTLSADSIVINTDYRTAMVTASLGLTYKEEITAGDIIGIKNPGGSIWGGVDPDTKTGYGVQGHFVLTKLGGVDLTDNTVPAFLIKLSIAFLPLLAS